MLSMLHSELFRLARRWMPRILFVILVMGVGTLYLLFFAIVRADSGAEPEVADLREALRLEAVRDMGMNLIFQIGGVLVVILTASLVGTEFGWGTIRTILPRARARAHFLTAKLVTSLLFTVVIVLAGTAVALATSGLISVLEDLPRSLGPDGGQELALAAGRTIFAMLPYLALTFFVTVWTRSVAAGIGVGISVLFLEGLLLLLIGTAGGPFERVPGALINRNVQALLAENGDGLDSTFTDPGTALPPVGQAALVLAGYTAAFIALAYYRFRNRDITVG